MPKKYYKPSGTVQAEAAATVADCETAFSRKVSMTSSADVGTFIGACGQQAAVSPDSSLGEHPSSATARLQLESPKLKIFPFFGGKRSECRAAAEALHSDGEVQWDCSDTEKSDDDDDDDDESNHGDSLTIFAFNTCYQSYLYGDEEEEEEEESEDEDGESKTKKAERENGEKHQDSLSAKSDWQDPLGVRSSKGARAASLVSGGGEGNAEGPRRGAMSKGSQELRRLMEEADFLEIFLNKDGELSVRPRPKLFSSPSSSSSSSTSSTASDWSPSLASVMDGRTCEICYDQTVVNTARECCNFPICDDCLVTYVTDKVSEGQARVQCPNCQKRLLDSEILDVLTTDDLRAKWTQYLVDATNDPKHKTCPSCGVPQTLPEEFAKKSKRKLRNGVPVTCESCDLYWCFSCHAPWHEGIRCKKFQKGDRAMKEWAKEVSGRGTLKVKQRNAQRCPGCKSYIQRNGGCTHMTCSKCRTNFCYECGDRFCWIDNRLFKVVIGNHHSKYSPLGCRQLLLPDQDAKRRLLRGSLTGARVVGCIGAGVGIVALGAGAAALLVAAGVVVGPFYGGYKLKRAISNRRRERRERRECYRLQRQHYGDIRL